MELFALLIVLAPQVAPANVSDHLVDSTLVPRSELPLRTRKREIIGAGGHRVHLYCVNWYGSHLEQLIPNGLNKQPLAKISSRIVELGFNCVRFPFSTEMAIDETLIGKAVPNAEVALAANPELQRESAFQVFNLTVRALTKVGLLVILNNHVSTSGWCCGDDDHEGLWYTTKYPEKDFMKSMRVMASCFKDDPLVIGFDIRNELRTSDLGSPTWGDGNPKTDWSMAVVEAAEHIISEAEDMLIIVSGLTYGTFLCQVPRRPIHISEPQLRGRVVYTAHDYHWFNYHYVVRIALEQYLVALSLVASGVVLCIIISWLAARKGLHIPRRLFTKMPQCRSHRLIRCHGKCCWLRLLCRRASAAIILTLFAVIGIAFGDSIFVGCGQGHLIMLLAVLFFATLSAAASFVLWMHMALICLVAFSAREDSHHDLDAEEQTKTPAHSSSLAEPETLGQQVHNAVPKGTSHMKAPMPLPLLRESTKAKKVRSAPFSQPRFWRCLAISEVLAMLGMLFYTWHAYGQYDAFEKELDQKWGFLLTSDSDEMPQAPVWLGEFGTDSQSLWWRHLMRYLRQRKVDWAYWALNGQKTLDQEESYGLLQEDMMTVRHAWKLTDLQALMT